MPLKSLKEVKYFLCLSNCGKLNFYAALYLPKEFKTFLIKIDSKVLSTIESETVDFDTFEYLDISKELTSRGGGSSKEKLLGYLFD